MTGHLSGVFRTPVRDTGRTTPPSLEGVSGPALSAWITEKGIETITIAEAARDSWLARAGTGS